MEMSELMERDLRSTFVEDEPPSIAENGSTTDIDADDHVTEEEPFANQWLSAVPWGYSHNAVVWRVEAQSSCGETVSDKIDPEKLNRN